MYYGHCGSGGVGSSCSCYNQQGAGQLLLAAAPGLRAAAAGGHSSVQLVTLQSSVQGVVAGLGVGSRRSRCSI